MRKYLPHRFKDSKSSTRNGRAGPPIGGSSGSTRNGGGGGDATPLSQARIEALKEAGYTPGTKEWKRMEQRYREMDSKKGA